MISRGCVVPVAAHAYGVALAGLELGADAVGTGGLGTPVVGHARGFGILWDRASLECQGVVSPVGVLCCSAGCKVLFHGVLDRENVLFAPRVSSLFLGGRKIDGNYRDKYANYRDNNQKLDKGEAKFVFHTLVIRHRVNNLG